VLAAGLVASLSSATAGPTGTAWPQPNHDLASTRASAAAGIDRGNVASLHAVWRFAFRGKPAESGSFTATPLVVGQTVYLEDMLSNVYALDLGTGRIRWRRYFDAAAPGPNGLSFADGRLFGTTDAAAFALDATTGRTLWRHFLATNQARYVEMGPLTANGIVYVSTIGLLPNGRGVLYALDARTGDVRWKLDTIKGRYAVPAQAGGGGAWYPPSVAGSRVYWGIANPYPYGGTRAHPNGGAYLGPALYTDSLLTLGARTGKLEWYDQVTRHDVRDYDFQLPPLLLSARGRPLVIGAGKAGRVVAWNRVTHRRVWSTAVGVHRHDLGPLPAQRVSVCPGLLGGVETPMAAAGGRVFVPVVDLCMKGSATGYEPLDRVNVAKRGRGELVALDAATGRKQWVVRLPQADFGCATVSGGVVFTATYDGTVLGLSTANGAVLWRARVGGGINSCPAVADGWLLVGAGVPRGPGSRLELTAFRIT